MTIGEAFRAEALTSTAIAAGVSTRIHPSTIPQRDAAMTAMYRVLPGVRGITHDGLTGWNMGGRIEVTVWGNDDAAATRVIEAFADKFGPLRGKMGGVSGVTVCVTGLVGPRSLYDSQSQMFGQQLDIICNIDMGTVS